VAPTAARTVPVSPTATAREGRPPPALVPVSAPEAPRGGPVLPVPDHRAQAWVPAVREVAPVVLAQAAARPARRGCDLWVRARWRLALEQPRAGRMVTTGLHPVVAASVVPRAPVALRGVAAVPVVLEAAVAAGQERAARAGAEPAVKS
jgi:hypothetical protein